jgi:hypothetical protein
LCAMLWLGALLRPMIKPLNGPSRKANDRHHRD